VLLFAFVVGLCLFVLLCVSNDEENKGKVKQTTNPTKELQAQQMTTKTIAGHFADTMKEWPIDCSNYRSKKPIPLIANQLSDQKT